MKQKAVDLELVSIPEEESFMPTSFQDSAPDTPSTDTSSTGTQTIQPAVAEAMQSATTDTMQGVQTLFFVDEAAWQEFNQLLDAPPRALPALQKLLLSQPAWDS